MEFQLRLRDHLARLFDKSKKTKSDLFSNERAMSKLFKEAGRLMHVLSANTRSVFQVCVCVCVCVSCVQRMCVLETGIETGSSFGETWFHSSLCHVILLDRSRVSLTTRTSRRQ